MKRIELKNTNFSNLHGKTVYDFVEVSEINAHNAKVEETTDAGKEDEYPYDTIGAISCIESIVEYKIRMRKDPVSNANELNSLAEASNNKELAKQVEKQFSSDLDAYFNE